MPKSRWVILHIYGGEGWGDRGRSTRFAAASFVGPSSLGNGGVTHNNKGNYVLGAARSSGVSASLANNVRPTKTHVLLSTSPAIDVGAVELAFGQTQM